MIFLPSENTWYIHVRLHTEISEKHQSKSLVSFESWSQGSVYVYRVDRISVHAAIGGGKGLVQGQCRQDHRDVWHGTQGA